jgi:hypothetical protein
MKKIILFFMTVNISIAMIIPIIASFFFTLLWFSVLRYFYGNNLPELYSGIGLCIASLIFGFCGIVQILRRESPGLALNKPFRGPWALFSGIMMTIIFEGGGIIMLIITLLRI